MSSAQKISSEILKKYNVAGPRYTSYPTVPYWETTPTEAEWITHIGEALRDAEAQNIGAAIYMHIPFCESLCTYCGCNTRITRNRGVSQPYTQTLLQEWDLYRQKLGRGSADSKKIRVAELHLGGGTPTFMKPEELATLLEGFLATVEVVPGAEFSVEADPRVTTREHLETLARYGFNRLSLGIQDFDPRVQEIVHRVQSEAQVQRLVNEARELGYTSINFDLIYGLPLQTADSVRQTVEAVIRLRPDRIAFYSYAHVPWIKASQRRFTEADLPSGDDKRGLYELGRTLFEAAGYREIGMDHFAVETDSLWKASQSGELHRNFMGYTSKHVSPLIGLGVSSIGDSWTAFMQNEKLLETWADRVHQGQLPIFRGHVLTQEDLLMRRHILNLMTRFETTLTGEHDPLLDQLPERLHELVADGLIELDAEHCRVHEHGRAFLRNVCMAFDARLVRKAPETKIFSQTI